MGSARGRLSPEDSSQLHHELIIERCKPSFLTFREIGDLSSTIRR